MDGVAVWPAVERRELFVESASRLGPNPVLIEKDFWVSWVLLRLASLPSDLPRLLFKGGTSLSKAYGLTRRFSEDIDLTIDRVALGLASDDDVPGLGSKQCERLANAAKAAGTAYVLEKLHPILSEAVAAILGDANSHSWSTTVNATSDGADIHFAYPRSLETKDYGHSNLDPEIRLELGARGAFGPAEMRAIRPLAAESFPDQFERSAVSVLTLLARRTFWEKATILHHAAESGSIADGARDWSRHPYDFVMVARTEIGREALADLSLLHLVSEHGRRMFGGKFFRRAVPGTLQLMPPEAQIGDVRRDYAEMREMFFEDPPALDELLADLRDVEEAVNAG